MFYNPLYLMFMLPALFLSIIASILLRYWNNKYSNTPNSKNLTGFDVVQKISEDYNLKISLSRTPKHLGDHYDPRSNELVISRDNADRPTISAVAITTHELGHAIQHSRKNPLLFFRKILVPAVNIGTSLGYVLIVIGLLVAALQQLAWLGILLFSLSTIFAFLTLPIEIDASMKAMKLIKKYQLLSPIEYSDAKKVLGAASLTYIAAAISSLSNLAYFIIRVNGISQKD